MTPNLGLSGFVWFLSSICYQVFILIVTSDNATVRTLQI